MGMARRWRKGMSRNVGCPIALDRMVLDTYWKGLACVGRHRVSVREQPPYLMATARTCLYVVIP